VNDLYSIAKDSHTTWQILDENVNVETHGQPFMELWLMRVEITILIEQYEKQRKEYENLYEKLQLHKQ